jgi:galactokinase
VSNTQIEWCCVPVIVDNATTDLFHMIPPNQDADQKPEFRVTRTTMELVPQDFERYQPSLQRMAEHWREEKEREMKKAKAMSSTQGA